MQSSITVCIHLIKQTSDCVLGMDQVQVPAVVYGLGYPGFLNMVYKSTNNKRWAQLTLGMYSCKRLCPHKNWTRLYSKHQIQRRRILKLCPLYWYIPRQTNRSHSNQKFQTGKHCWGTSQWKISWSKSYQCSCFIINIFYLKSFFVLVLELFLPTSTFSFSLECEGCGKFDTSKRKNKQNLLHILFY